MSAPARVPASLTRAWEAAVAFAFPLACAACERLLAAHESGLVCGACWNDCRRLPAPQCDRCGHPQPPGVTTCQWCAHLPPYVRAVRSWCWMGEGGGGRIVHALKYRGWHGVAEGMAERLARLDWPPDVRRERALVVPVPLAPDRLRARGFNQAEALAVSVAARWGIPARADVIQRTRGGTRAESQTRLTPTDRAGNVKGCFVSPDFVRAELRGAHVIVVDDVVTTAATLNACAEALVAAGVRIVSYVTFGRARAIRDRFAS
ncbi:MAG: ComF family protein [Gemmatimonadetes bacterium]|nr:ComF family protein [Gemmatimonadota bacterium]